MARNDIYPKYSHQTNADQNQMFINECLTEMATKGIYPKYSHQKNANQIQMSRR